MASRAAVVTALACAACPACADDVAASARMRVVFGLESPAWPEAEGGTLAVTRIASGGERTAHSTLKLPRETFALGAGGASAFEAVVRSAAGADVAIGRSLSLDPLDFVGIDLPLFAGRRGRFGGVAHLETDGSAPSATILAGRFVLVASTAPANVVPSQLLDLATWSPVAEPPALRCPAPPCTYTALVGTSPASSLALAVGDDWGAWLDFETLASTRADPPAGVTFAELAGGRAITGADGFTYLVGAARTQAPSAAVLRIAADGATLALRLGAPRRGAAVTYAPGVGLVVAGGGGDGTGAEVLPPGDTRWRSLGYPPDPTRGAALVAVGATWRRVGGVDDADGPATSVTLDLACESQCPLRAEGPTLDVRDAVGFATDSDGPVVVGRGPGDLVVALTPEGAALPMRARRAAAAVALPTGHVAIVGGSRPDGAPETALEVLGP